MVRKIITMFLAILLTGCQISTEYGKVRKLTARKNVQLDIKVFSLIDTTKIYEQIGAVDTIHNEALQSVKQEFIKFYNDGKVATFSKYDPNDISSLNPKKADMGYYEFKDGNLKTRFFFEHPQGGGWIKGIYKKNIGNDLYMTSGNLLLQYKAHKLSDKFLIYKPDW